MIAELGTFAPSGYNSSLGGLGPSGAVWTDERKASQSARVKGVPLAAETRAKMSVSALENNAFRGKKHSAEALAKIGAATVRTHTGAVRSAEARANISASLVGRAAPVLSAEARARQAAAQRKPNAAKSNPGERNGMFGVRGGLHPSAKRIGVWLRESSVPHTFDSASEAAAFLGVKSARLSGWLRGYRVPPDGTLVSHL